MDSWQRNAVGTDRWQTTPLISIVIDDLGVDPAMAQRLTAFQGPLTAAFLPGSPDLSDQVELVRRAGHEILVHVPMESLPRAEVKEADDARSQTGAHRRATVLRVLQGEAGDPGADTLLVGRPASEIRRRLGDTLSAFGGYVGINNHRGSRFTADEDGMRVVMDELKRRGLIFLDSMTTTNSVGTRLAREFGVPQTARDVFLDQLGDPVAIRARLTATEAIARRRGKVVAIGHARQNTLDCLADWLPEIVDRGYALAPVSAIADIDKIGD
jgi:polysaccharide deacetylase 2 family uncharacterized protein YibQ